MRKNQQILKLFLALILSTGYILGFSHFGSAAYKNLVSGKDLMKQGTSIGSLDVSGKNKAEVKKMLEEASEKWKQESTIQFTYKEASETVDPGVLFEIDRTVAGLKTGEKNFAHAFIDEDTLREAILNTSVSLSSEAVDFDRLAEDITSSAAALSPGDFTFHLENYLDGSSETVVIAKAKINAGKYADELRGLTELLQQAELESRQTFSLLKAVEALGEKTYSGGALSRLATGIYEVILPTNFAILERTISPELPGYAQLGMEAKISRAKDFDLVFQNVNDRPYVLEFSTDGSMLEVVLKGTAFLHTYSIQKSAEKRWKPRLIKQYSALLSQGEIQIPEPGQEGVSIKVTRTTIDEHGKETAKEVISDDFYPPIDKIEIHSLYIPKEESDPEELPEEEAPEDGAEEEDMGNENEDTLPEDGSIEPVGELPEEEGIPEKDHTEDRTGPDTGQPADDDEEQSKAPEK